MSKATSWRHTFRPLQNPIPMSFLVCGVVSRKAIFSQIYWFLHMIMASCVFAHGWSRWCRCHQKHTPSRAKILAKWVANGCQKTSQNGAPKKRPKVFEMVPKRVPKWDPKTDQNDVLKAFRVRSGPRGSSNAHFGAHEAAYMTLFGSLSAQLWPHRPLITQYLEP